MSYEVQPVVSTDRCSNCGGVGERSVCGTSKPNQNKSYPEDSQKLVGTLNLTCFHQKLGDTDHQESNLIFSVCPESLCD